jgi:hypothetical protein
MGQLISRQQKSSENSRFGQNFIMRTLLTILMLSILGSCQVSNPKSDTDRHDISHASEDEAIKKAVADAYTCISFKKGEKPAYDDIRNYFIPQAQFLDFRNDTLEILTLDQFLHAYRNFIESNGIATFYEEEIKGNTDEFGRVAQRMSTYKTYLNTLDSVAQRGVNSFQLVKTPEGWKVSSIIWDIESPKLAIPDYYLHKDSAQ